MSTRTQQGYSMLEMMIALATTLVVSAAAFALMRGSLKVANATYNVTEAEQSLRSGHEVINRDLTKAGDGLRGIGTINAPVAFVSGYLTRTPVTCINDATLPCVGLVTSDDSIPPSTAIPQVSPAANFLSGSDRISMIVRDTDFNLGNSVSVPVGKLTISAANTNIVVGTTTEINLFHVGEIYALTSQTNAAFFVVSAVNTTTKTVTITNGDSYGINANSSTSPLYKTAGVTAASSASTVASSIMRLQIIQYFVTDTNLLMRRVFGVQNAGFLDTVVAEHVTNMQFRYLTNLIDPNNGFVRQPFGNLSSGEEQTAVRQVETTLGVETLRAVNVVTNSNSSSTACGANPNGKQNICSTTSTTVRNLQFRTAL